MAWKEPKTDWKPSEALVAEDMNRIEGNTAELKNMANQTNENIGDIIADLAKIGLRGQTGVVKASQDGIKVTHTDLNTSTDISKYGHKVLDNYTATPKQIGGTMEVEGSGRPVFAASALINPNNPDVNAMIDDDDNLRLYGRRLNPGVVSMYASQSGTINMAYPSGFSQLNAMVIGVRIGDSIVSTATVTLNYSNISISSSYIEPGKLVTIMLMEI